MALNSKTLSFNFNDGIIRISHEVFKLLKFPEFIRILLNIGEKRIIIQPTDKNDTDRISINYNIKTFEDNPRIHSKLLVEKIYITSGWDLEKRYRVNIDYDSARGVFAADLTKASETGAK